MKELQRVSAQPDALTVLSVGASIAPEVERNITLDQQPAAPASSIYSGVLYAAAHLGELNGEAAMRAQNCVVTVSALWGAVSPTDAIPAYRLSMNTNLGDLGRLSTLWRKELDAVLAPRATGDVVVDCRSSSYIAAWKPAATLPTEWVSVKVLRDVNGKRSVVSHNAKHARGVLTHHLLTRNGEEPRTAQALAQAARECDHFLEVTLHDGPKNTATLELVVA